MERLPFVIWMLGYPLLCSITTAVSLKVGTLTLEKYEKVAFVAITLQMVTWIYIGIKLYE